MLQVNNLTKKYENGVIGLKNVSFQTDDNGFIAIVGPSGCGKSTLLNLLSGNDTVTSGNILFNNKKLTAKSSALSDDFAVVYQDYKLIENISVWDNLMIAKELSGSNISTADIFSILNEIDIAECKNEKVYNLSGGQKQRVAIARALVKQPKVIFADEPTGNLDSINSKIVFNLLKKISQKHLIVIVTHDIDMAEKYADRIIKLRDGSIIDDCVLNDSFKTEVGNQESLKRNKKGLSFKSSLSLAVAFNKAKKGRRIAFILVSILVLLLNVVAINWGMVSYDRMVYATFDKHKNSEVLVAEYPVAIKNDKVEYDKYLDLTAFTNELNKKNINTAKVYPMRFVKSLRNDDDTNSFMLSYRTIDGEYMSIAESKSYSLPDDVIVTNNPEEVGINIIEGVAPKKLGEVAIPKGWKTYFNARGGIIIKGEPIKINMD